jgi:hypothetical protein
MDVRRVAVVMVGAAMLSRWRLQEQMLDDATTEGGGWRREASSLLRRTTSMDGIFPAAGATATDAAMPLSPPTDDGDD